YVDQLDLLYEEAVYTVVNRVGVASPEHVKSDEELFAYLLKVVFVFSQRAGFSLRVSVMKAKNLMAKDANGYSDPYCMLGILVGQSPRETEEKKERKFIHTFFYTVFQSTGCNAECDIWDSHFDLFHTEAVSDVTITANCHLCFLPKI
uniref:C2 domain-containing protein n=1 Tax=Sphaeramia orbicularis TaxID=375764 RepID=A0A672YCM3_9TELE